MQSYCCLYSKNPLFCGGCLQISYCSNECAEKDWDMNHIERCGKRIPTETELDEWIDRNPSGWVRGTVPRGWPEDWIYDPSYFGSDEEEEEEELSPSIRDDDDDVPPTVIVKDEKRQHDEEKEEEEEEEKPRARRRLIFSPMALMRSATMDAQFFQVLKGSGTSIVNGVEVPLYVGAVLIAPQNSPRRIKAGKDGMVLLVK